MKKITIEVKDKSISLDDIEIVYKQNALESLIVEFEKNIDSIFDGAISKLDELSKEFSPKKKTKTKEMENRELAREQFLLANRAAQSAGMGSPLYGLRQMCNQSSAQYASIAAQEALGIRF